MLVACVPISRVSIRLLFMVLFDGELATSLIIGSFVRRLRRQCKTLGHIGLLQAVALPIRVLKGGGV